MAKGDFYISRRSMQADFNITKSDVKVTTKICNGSPIRSKPESHRLSVFTPDTGHKAVKQARSVDAQHLRWWVLWLAIQCDASADAMLEEAIGSLFGVRQVVYYDPHSEQQPMRNCLFATPGVFERHPEIVATVVDSGGGHCFCVNDQFAGDFSSFRESVLWSFFARIHPPMTAADLTESRGFFRADLSVDRKDDSALVASLERDYGLEKAILLDMQVHSTSMVPSLRDSRI